MSRPHRVRYRVLSRSSFVEESLFGYVRGGSGPPRLPHAIPGPRETSPNDAGEMDLSRTPSTRVNESRMNSVCRLQRLQPSFFDESPLHSPSPPTEPSWQPPQTPLVLAPYGRPMLWSPPIIGLRRPFTADPAIAPTRVPSSMSVIGAAGSAQIASTSKTETTMKQKERRKIWRQNTESDAMVTSEQLMPELRGLKSGREATRPGSVDGRLPGSGNAKRPSWSLPSKSRTVNERPPWR